MWRLGFFFHDMAYGLLSVFIPLYVATSAISGGLGGSLIDLGIIVSLAVFCTIPASYFWGWICDKTRHYKAFILLSFLSSAIILFLFTFNFTQNLIVFAILYVLMAILHVSHEAPKNVLVAEHYSRDQWGKSYAIYEAVTEVGFIIGLLLGFATFTSTLSFGTDAICAFYIASALSIVAFITSIFLIADPIMNFERRLVGIERKIDFTYRGVEASSNMASGYMDTSNLKQTRFLGFGLAILLFSLATSTFFTPLPVFFKEYLGLGAGLVFIVYVVNSAGATLGYFLIRNRAYGGDPKSRIGRFILLRSFLVFLLVAVVQLSFYSLIMAGILLAAIGFAYAMYAILMLSNSMEIIPEGKTGLFDVLVGLGAGVGSFIGPYLCAIIGYLPTFLIVGVLFLAAFVTLKVFG